MPNIYLNPKYFIVKGENQNKYIQFDINRKCLYPPIEKSEYFNRIMVLRISFINNKNESLAWVLRYGKYPHLRIKIFEYMQDKSFSKLTNNILN
jgi:hypothetical protein